LRLRSAAGRYRFSAFGFRLSAFGFRLSAFGFRLSAFGFRLSAFERCCAVALMSRGLGGSRPPPTHSPAAIRHARARHPGASLAADCRSRVRAAGHSAARRSGRAVIRRLAGAKGVVGAGGGAREDQSRRNPRGFRCFARSAQRRRNHSRRVPRPAEAGRAPRVPRAKSEMPAQALRRPRRVALGGSPAEPSQPVCDDPQSVDRPASLDQTSASSAGDPPGPTTDSLTVI
jgi:hypothetical protein